MTDELLITHPSGYVAERRYALRVLFEQRLGLAAATRVGPPGLYRITLPGNDRGPSLVLPDVFFPLVERGPSYPLPKEPLDRWRPRDPLQPFSPTDTATPVLYGRPDAQVGYFGQRADGEWRLNVDVVATVFFMLTRYEEIASTTRDEHGRFPASASLAAREKFLERPIVDEHADILGLAIARVWPRLERRKRPAPRVLISHDVDYVTSTRHTPIASVVRSSVGDAIRRRDAVAAGRRLSTLALGRRLGRSIDPYNTFDFLMSQSEAAGLRSEFYLISKPGLGGVDGNYDLRDPETTQLVREIVRRGHSIGYHASYSTYRDPEETRRELNVLAGFAREQDAEPDQWRGRQHFLRWEAPTTWRNWEFAGADVDSTLGFADAVGFRCGYCHEFPVFDVRRRAPLRLTERPLIAMDQSLTRYMGLPLKDVPRRVLSLSEKCRFYGGDFTLLWHNTSLVSAASRRCYQTIIRGLGSHVRHPVAA